MEFVPTRRGVFDATDCAFYDISLVQFRGTCPERQHETCIRGLTIPGSAEFPIFTFHHHVKKCPYQWEAAFHLHSTCLLQGESLPPRVRWYRNLIVIVDLDNNVLENVTSVKDLGLLVSNDLKWTCHLYSKIASGSKLFLSIQTELLVSFMCPK